MEIDTERLRRDLEAECMGAFFGGGFGGAMAEASDIQRAGEAELLSIAQRMGVDISDYTEEE